MSTNQDFRDNLLKQEEFCKEDMAGYRQSLQNQLNEKLGPVCRAGYGIICLASLLIVIYFVKLAFFMHIGNEMMQLSIQLISIIAIVLFGILGFMTGRAATTSRSMGFYLAFVFGGSVLLLLYYFVTILYFIYIAPITLENPLEPSSMLANQVMTILFFAMVLVGILLIFRSVTKAAFQNQRKLLEIEYKLCEIMERLEKPQK